MCKNMGKQGLVGGMLREMYSKKVSDRMNHPTHRGEITEDECKEMHAKLVIADWGAEACGDMVRLFLAVDPKTNVIKKARFFSFGCGTAIASSDAMCELVEGKTVDEALQVNNLVVEAYLRDTPDKPAVPPQKMHCSVMAHDVIKAAASIYKGVDVEELEGREIVCDCARVTLGTIKEVIRLNDLHTVEEITNYTKAGGFCGSCVRPGGHEKKKMYLVDILKQTREEMEKEKREAEAKKRLEAQKGNDFKKLPLIKRLDMVENTLEAHVRPTLQKDGGDCEVLQLKDNADGTTTIFITYTGACADCDSARTSTLSLIQNALREHVDSSIVVVPQFDAEEEINV